jgi:predicted phage tail component-like protein
MSILVDGIDLAEFGFTATRTDGLYNGPERTRETAEAPGLDAAQLLTPEGTLKPRRIVVEGVQSAPTRAGLLSIRDRLLGWLSHGELEIATRDQPDRGYRGRLERADPAPIAPHFASRGARFGFVVLCPDPHAYDAEPTELLTGAGGIEIPLGTGPVRPLLRLAGPAEAPAIVYRDARGEERARLTLPGTTLGAGHWIDLDCHRMTARDHAGNNAAAALGDDSRWIRLDPYDAAGPEGPWPTIEATAGALTLTYRRAWL